MRRLVEFPWLDERNLTYRANEPRRRHPFYRLPPYIRHVDLQQEVIVVSNPDSKPIHLAGYYLTDKGDVHRFEFEDDYVLPGGADVYVYCAPGRGAAEDMDRPNHYVLWTNKDGQLRRKQVLNPTGEKITLLDRNAVEVAALEVTERGGTRHHFYTLERLQRERVGRLVSTLQLGRLTALVVAFVFGVILCRSPWRFLICDVIAICCDFMARACDTVRLRYSLHQTLSILLDRFEVLCFGCVLLVNLAKQRSETSTVVLIAVVLVCNEMSAWAEILRECTGLPLSHTVAGHRLKDFDNSISRSTMRKVVVFTVTASQQLYLLWTLYGLAVHSVEIVPSSYVLFVLGMLAQLYRAYVCLSAIWDLMESTE